MSFENIEIQHGNFTIDRSGGTFYTVDHVAGTLIAKSPNAPPTPPTIVQTYTLDLLYTQINEVLSLQFDGYYYWTLEKPVPTGFRIRKWEIGTDDIVRIEQEWFFSSDAINKYDVNALAVEHYYDSLDNQEVAGTTVFDVNDGDIIRAGDKIVVGPSTATGFVGLYGFTTVIGKVGNTLTVDIALGITFSPNDPITFTRDFYVFSDTAPGNLLGAMYTFRAKDGFPQSFDVSNLYGKVRAATFFKNKVMFIRGNEIIWLNPDTKTIFKSQAIENSTENRAGIIDTFDLDGYSDTFYRLEQQHVYLDGSDWQTEVWSPLYNYNTSGTIPDVFFVSVKADPPILHRDATGVGAGDIDSAITVTVLDQFRTPVSGILINFASTHGPLAFVQRTTDNSGQAFNIYTATTSSAEVTITVTAPAP